MPCLHRDAQKPWEIWKEGQAARYPPILPSHPDPSSGRQNPQTRALCVDQVHWSDPCSGTVEQA